MRSPLRIGYVGSLDPGGTCRSRLLALQGLEPAVFPLDTDPAFSARGPSRWLEPIPGLGAGSRRMNRDLIRLAREHTLNVIWIDKGQWVAASTLAELKRMGVRLIHHVTDALWPRTLRLRITRVRLASTARHYDRYITSNAADFQRLQRVMPGRVVLSQLGYDEARFESSPVRDPAVEARWRSEVVFVGHHEPRTERGVCALIDAGLPVRVFGQRWLHRAQRNGKLVGHVGGSLENQDYVWALKLARIGLCFVSEWNYNETAGRSYEIPACGTFLLAMRTAEHLRDYREGVEAEFFADEAELVAKVRRYLADDEARGHVARSGWKRCVSSGYSWREIMTRDWAAAVGKSREPAGGTV